MPRMIIDFPGLGKCTFCGTRYEPSVFPFKNSLIPVVTSIGPELFLMIGGSVIIEQIFSLPGIGRLTLQAIETRDYPVVSGVLLFFSIGLILINLIIDISYALLDPRVRFQ